MMKSKKLLSLLLTTAVASSILAGCNKAGAPTASDADKSASEDKKPITFTVFSKDPNANYENFESPVAKEIQKRTGVTLKMEYPVGELDQKIGLMIASNDYPDMIFGEQSKLISAGALVKLDDYIENFGANVKALYGEDLVRLRYNLDDPSIYFLGSFGVGAERWEPNMGFELQHDAVKAAGFPKIKTLEDAEKVIKDYVAKNPSIGGQQTIGLSLIFDDWRWQSAVGNMGAFVSGMPDDGQWYIDTDKKEAKYRFTLDNHKEYFKWLNHMNDIGLLDKDSFTQKFDQYSAKIAAGRVVALNDQLWQYRDAQTSLVKDKKYERTYGTYPVTLNDSIKNADFTDTGYSASYGMGITKSCKDPERAFKFLDWMASDEAQILNNWGIEGIHYTVKDGKRVISDEEMQKRNTDPEYSKKTGIGAYGYPFPQRGDGVLDKTGQTYTVKSPGDIIKNYNPVEKEVLKAYGVEMWKDLYPKKEELPKSAWGQAWGIAIPQDTDLAEILQKANDISKAGVAKAVLAKPADFDTAWNEMQTKLTAAGIEKANAEFTKLLQGRLELWKK